jgi:hypothetical protein
MPRGPNITVDLSNIDPLLPMRRTDVYQIDRAPSNDNRERETRLRMPGMRSPKNLCCELELTVVTVWHSPPFDRQTAIAPSSFFSPLVASALPLQECASASRTGMLRPVFSPTTSRQSTLWAQPHNETLQPLSVTHPQKVCRHVMARRALCVCSPTQR